MTISTNDGVPWPATDALGRELPLSTEVGAPKSGRFVGMFYFLWHDKATVATKPGGGPWDISKILEADPGAAKNPSSPLWGPPGGTFHYWGEPLYGYYQSDDEWVIRRHAQLLSDAGIDTLIFDTTNAQTYRDTYMKLLQVFSDIRREGGRAPQVAFMVHTENVKTAQKLRDELYSPGLHKDLWFQWQGKPLLIGVLPQDAPPEMREFFTLRDAHWPFTMVNTRDAWHWEATYPQPYGYHDDENTPEQINVSVAQNLNETPDGHTTSMSTGTARGRSYHDGKNDTTEGALNNGANFAEQWIRALQIDPSFVMVTGWNEWIAGRWGDATNLEFVDQFDQQFSRDIEPVRGLHGDNYYYQLVANVRRYKGAPPLPKSSPAKTIQIAGEFSQWESVAPSFASPGMNDAPRDHDGNGGAHYENSTTRNVFQTLKVARDADNVYFYASTRNPIAEHGTYLFLNTDASAQSGWNGYDFRISRAPQNGFALLEKRDGAAWKSAGRVVSRVLGNQMQLQIPRAMLNLSKTAPLTLDFKWADNLQNPDDIMDFYVSGAVAPAGRFNFRYQTS